MDYKASMDTQALLITIVAIIICIYAGINSTRIIINSGGDMKLISYGLFLLVLSLFVPLGCYCLNPMKYILTDTELVIVKPLGSKIIKLDSVIRTEKYRAAAGTNATIKTFGIGGIFGYSGMYYNSKIGNLRFYVTRKNHRILITTKNNKNIVIAPNDFKMYDELKKRISNI
jgi:hypothetical protein